MPSFVNLSRRFRRSCTVAAFALATGCGGGGGTPDDSLLGVDAAVGVDAFVAAAPHLIETFPANGSKAVAEDTVFVFRFSEAMNTAATIAAYQSVSLPAESVSFQWNDTADTLTIVPNDPLPYATGPADIGAYGYAMRIGTAATNVAGVHLAADVELSVTTLRRIVVAAPVVAALTGRATSAGASSTALVGAGDFAGNASVSAFMSFSISSLPVGVILESARIVVSEGTISGTPDDDLGTLSAEHIAFESLDSSAYGAELLAALPNTSVVERSKGPPYERVVTVTSFVQDDLDNREARNERTQARVRFALPTDSNDDPDYLTIVPASVSLEIRYLAE